MPYLKSQVRVCAAILAFTESGIAKLRDFIFTFMDGCPSN